MSEQTPVSIPMDLLWAFSVISASTAGIGKDTSKMGEIRLFTD